MNVDVINKMILILEAIKDFADNNTTHQRNDLYSFLENRFNIELPVNNSDQRSDGAKIAYKDPNELFYVVKLILEKINKKVIN